MQYSHSVNTSMAAVAARSVLLNSVITAAGSHFSMAVRMIFAKIWLLCWASAPPFSTMELPLLIAKIAASTVTFGRDPDPEERSVS